jgi:hypothetical protein
LNVNFCGTVPFFSIFTSNQNSTRMKKSLLILGLFIGSLATIKAQCVIANSCTPTSGYCSTPASGSALPNATEGAAYSTTIQVSLATTYSVATINNATVTAITGLPTGLSYSTNPTNGVINGGSDGCILIAGTPATGSAGSYAVTASVTVNTNFGPFPGTLTWSLTVDAPLGITSQTNNQGTLLLSPNPATTQLSVAADFHFQKVNLFDALGSLAFSTEVGSLNRTNVDLGKLNPGIYFIQVTDGRRSITRKFIKE